MKNVILAATLIALSATAGMAQGWRFTGADTVGGSTDIENLTYTNCLVKLDQTLSQMYDYGWFLDVTYYYGDTSRIYVMESGNNDLILSCTPNRVY